MLKKLINLGKGGKGGFSITGAFTSSFKDIMGGVKFANKILFGSNGKGNKNSNKKQSVQKPLSFNNSNNNKKNKNDFKGSFNQNFSNGKNFDFNKNKRF